MKKIFLLFLIFIFATASMTIVYAETIEEQTDVIQIDPVAVCGADDTATQKEQGNSVEYKEVFQNTDINITENGSRYTVFFNKDSEDYNKICIILIDSEIDTEQFIESTDWNVFSAIDNYILACIGYDWDTGEDPCEYYEDVYNDLTGHFETEDKDVFIIGYESGAEFAAEEVCNHHDRYRGFASFGDYGLTSEQISEYSDTCKSWNMNVWMVNDTNTTSLQQNLSFWKKINNITAPFDSSYKTSYSDYMYMSAISTAGKINTNDKGTGIVYFNKESDFYSRSVTSDLCRNFINSINGSTAEFSGDLTGGEIYAIQDYRFSFYRQEYEGQQRDYWMYVPSGYDSQGTASPLILCLHGNYGNGEDMIMRSQWNTVAENNNCIVIFPTSLYKEAFQHYWQNIDEEMSWLRNLIETTCEEYNIDLSRIYVTGYSNGAGMAQNLAINFSDIIAAAAMGAPAYFDSEYYGIPDHIYPVAVVYSFGTEDKYLKEYGYTPAIDDEPAINHLEYWRMMYHFDQDDYSLDESSDGISIYTFCTEYHIPVASWVVVEGKGHTYPKEEVQNMYDFLSAYTKDSEGNLYFRGQLVRND